MAANDIKRLAQSQLAATATNVYGPATASGTMIKEMVLINLGGTSETVELFVGTTGTSAAANTVYKVVLSPGDTAVFDGMMMVPSGQFLVGRTTTATTVTVSMHGMEMT